MRNDRYQKAEKQKERIRRGRSRWLRKLIVALFGVSVIVFLGLCISVRDYPVGNFNAGPFSTESSTLAPSAQDAQAANGQNSAAGTQAPNTQSAASSATIPDYSGDDVIELNGNVPSFTEYEIASITGEHYSELDSLGRCGTAYAMLHNSMLPTGERGSIQGIRPSGWNQEKYPGLVDSEPPYLWNRCHLIAFGLTGQNANERNLITGTRYMNATTMLPYEEMVMHYLYESDNHVLYRVTPHFVGSELVARGVEMEARSVEDHGAGVCYHVFVYNIQPGVGIDYRDGDSFRE